MFSAISWLDSYSEYAKEVEGYFEANVDPRWGELRERMRSILAEDERIQQVVRLVGEDVLPDEERLLTFTAYLVKNGYLQQSAFGPDAYSPPAKGFLILSLILHFYEKTLVLIKQGVPFSLIREGETVTNLSHLKELSLEEIQSYSKHQGSTLLDRVGSERLATRGANGVGGAYRGEEIYGPFVLVGETRKGVSYGELAEVKDPSGTTRLGQVMLVSEEATLVQVFAGTQELVPEAARVRFLGKGLEMKLSPSILGRVLSGLGEDRDGCGPVFGSLSRDVNGMPINPMARSYPRNFIHTGISALDILSTLIRGQKLPIFSGNGLPHNKLAAQIANQSRLVGEENFAVVFAGIGVKRDDAAFFMNELFEKGCAKNIVVFLNLADDPVIERIATPRFALTAAEYLAFDMGMHVLVIMTDMTSYCEALRELGVARGEVPSRKGYPGYMYSDLASIYERAGVMHGGKGSLTQLPILTMPNDDITHPIPDLTGYITEGQIVLSRELDAKGVYPPIDVLSSLSRLMKDGIGKGYTREDHPDVASQLFASYSRVQDVRALASVVGEDELSQADAAYVDFGKAFEERFVRQSYDEDRDIGQSLDMAWELLKLLPKGELTRISKEEIERRIK